MELDAARAKSRAIWEEMSSGWGRDSDYIWDVSRQVGQWMVDRVQPRPGETVLEIAAGSGDTGFVAARLVGDEGWLISTDFSPGMVGAARARAEAQTISNAEFRVMDAENMDLTDASVDVALCRWGYMLMLDPARALHETRRVLREEGRLAFSTWGAPDKNPWATVVGRALTEIDRPPGDVKGPGGLFSMADPELVRAMVERAGFGEVELEEVEMVWQFPDFAAVWIFYTEVAGAVAVAINALSAEDKDRFRTTLETLLAPYLERSGYELPGMCLNVFAR